MTMPLNRPAIITTFDTFQLLTSELNSLAFANITSRLKLLTSPLNTQAFQTYDAYLLLVDQSWLNLTNFCKSVICYLLVSKVLGFSDAFWNIRSMFVTLLVFNVLTNWLNLDALEKAYAMLVALLVSQ